MGIDPNVSRRRLVDIRCGFAELARREADAAEDRVIEARLACDAQLASVVQTQTALDRGGSQAAKEEAHRTFRTAVVAARDHPQVEAAATVWLGEINRANAVMRAAQQRVRHEREAAELARTRLDRVTATAEASRTMADAADKACRLAQEALAESERNPMPEVAVTPEALVTAPTASAVAVPAATTVVAAAAAPARPGSPEPPAPVTAAPSPALPFGDRPEPLADGLVVDPAGRHSQAIVRLMRRDNATLTMLVDRLSSDAAGRSCWQLLLSDFVDAVSAAAMDAGFFEFPVGNPFWDRFTGEEAREVTRGLAALGFRYDGMGGFADGRVPGQRDLALAVGQAGMNPVRIRFWPHPAEAADLFRQVSVATDLFIVDWAPALTLGELVRLLGRRAETLTDLWNDWPRVRPLLFTTSGG